MLNATKYFHNTCPYNSKVMVTYAIKDNTTRPSTVAWNETFQINDKHVSFKIDTGSDVNLISYDLFKKLKPKTKLMPATIKLFSYSGHIINILGASDVKCTKNGKEIVLKFFVTNMNSESVLGLKACMDFGIVSKTVAPAEVHSAEKIIKLYSDVFDPQEIIRCCPYHISLLPNTKPSQALICRKVVTPLRGKLETELRKMIENAFLDPVDEPSAWAHPVAFVPKNSDELGIYMDCRYLNKCIVKANYPIPNIEEFLLNMKGAQYFSILSAPKAFTQVPLDETSSKICTVVTPCGKFRYKTIPYGLARSSEIYHNIASDIFGDIGGICIFVEDILIYGKTKDEHNSRLTQVLERARKYNIKYSKNQLQLAKPDLNFMGYYLSKNGISVDSSKVETIRALTIPINKQELQRFLNMISYLDQSVPNLSLHCEPLRKLLDKSERFIWNKQQETAFCTLKDILCELPLLKRFNASKTLYIAVAASSYGLAAVALQDFQPLGFYSTAFNSTQQKYSQIEKKLLAVLFGLEKFYFYTYGKETVIQSDHRPLISIIKEPFDNMDPKIQKIVIKLMKFSFKLEYVAGKDFAIPYALCRSTKQSSAQLSNKVKTKISQPHALLCAHEEQFAEFKRSLTEDPILQQIISYIKDGWPRYSSWIKSDAKNYFSIRKQLKCHEGLIFYDEKLVVPQREKPKILKQLHSAHKSTKTCQEKARGVYYWPTMMKDIESFGSNCPVCQKFVTQNSETCQNVPDLPWNKIGVGFVHVDKKEHVIIVDCFSKFLIVKAINLKLAKIVIGVLEDTFSTHGIPLEVVTLDIPPFNTSEWKIFMKMLGIKHRTSSDGVLKSHTLLVKTFIKKGLASKGLFMAVLEHNATPMENLPSPSELLMGRKVRTLGQNDDGNVKNNGDQNHIIINLK